MCAPNSKLPFNIDIMYQGMVIILVGNSELGAPVMSKLFYLICLRHLIRYRAVNNRIFSSKDLFRHTYAPNSKLPSNYRYFVSGNFPDSHRLATSPRTRLYYGRSCWPSGSQ